MEHAEHDEGIPKQQGHEIAAALENVDVSVFDIAA
jgi:hypothetical protein